MKKVRQYKVGDKIVEPGIVHTIFKIENQKNYEGKLEKVIFFRPFFKANNKTKITCSIPVTNIRKVDLRRVVSKKELQKLLGQLKKRVTLKSISDAGNLKELLHLNDLAEIVKVLKILRREKNTSENFSKRKRDLMNIMTESLTQEFASVAGISLDTASEKITKILQN